MRSKKYILTGYFNIFEYKKLLSMDFVSQEHRVPHDGPKDSNAGGCTREILDRHETR
jgi:hypothetical protein